MHSSFCSFVNVYLRGGLGGWGWFQWVGAITFTKDRLFTSCTNEMNILWYNLYKKVQVGKDQEKAQSERDSHSKNRGGKKPN